MSLAACLFLPGLCRSPLCHLMWKLTFLDLIFGAKYFSRNVHANYFVSAHKTSEDVHYFLKICFLEPKLMLKHKTQAVLELACGQRSGVSGARGRTLPCGSSLSVNKSLSALVSCPHLSHLLNTALDCERPVTCAGFANSRCPGLGSRELEGLPTPSSPGPGRVLPAA